MTNPVSLCDISRDWLEYIRPQIKESTFIKYRNIIGKYILPSIGTSSPAVLTRQDIEDFCLQLLEDGGADHLGLSPKTVSDTLSVLRQIFDYTELHCDIATPDIHRIRVRQKNTQLNVLSRPEQDRLTDYLFSHPCGQSLGVLLSLYMGLRLGEVCALKWEDISLIEHKIYVHHTMQRLQSDSDTPGKTHVMITTPKSPCSVRHIPIPIPLLIFISDHRKSKDGFFLTNRSDKFIEPRTMQKYFRTVLAETGIKPASFHILRHTFATRCVELGMDTKCLSEILGHSSVNITLNRYVHPSMEQKSKNMELLSELIARQE